MAHRFVIESLISANEPEEKWNDAGADSLAFRCPLMFHAKLAAIAAVTRETGDALGLVPAACSTSRDRSSIEYRIYFPPPSAASRDHSAMEEPAGPP